MGLLRPIYPMSREEHRGSNRFIIIMDAALKAELATTPRRRKEHRSNERRQTREGGIYRGRDIQWDSYTDRMIKIITINIL